jgi:hypothetical protein
VVCAPGQPARTPYPPPNRVIRRLARTRPIATPLELDVSDTCAATSRANHEPLAGTAAVATGWLLIEQSGPWGRDALTESGLDPAVGGALTAAAIDLPVRVQTIRRPGRGGSAGPRPDPRTVVLAHGGATPWMETLELTSDDEVARLDPAVCARPEPPGLGRRRHEPLYLVCTHGKRDRCCATLGRPIADTLAALHLDAVWEVSHIGGHRFAGNLVVLPEGLVYGGLDVADAVRTVSLHEAGSLELAHLRGRSALPRPAQAAEVLLRRELDVDALTAVTVERTEEDAGGTATVLLDVDGRGRWSARVAKEPLGTSALTSCDATEPEDPGGYRLVELSRS